MTATDARLRLAPAKCSLLTDRDTSLNPHLTSPTKCNLARRKETTVREALLLLLDLNHPPGRYKIESQP